MYIFVVRGWNCEKTIERCLKSILAQKGDFRISVILDPGKDDSYRRAVDSTKDANVHVNIHVNGTRLGPMANTYYGIELSPPNPEDIICMVDADDWIYEGALETLNKYYDHNTMLTYGSFILDCTGKKSRICKPYHRKANVRTDKWRATHMRTFRYSLFHYIAYDNFTHKGKWIQAASDLASMIPMIEMAGLDRCKYVKEPIYHYNNKTKYSIKRDIQRKWERIIRAKKPLERIA